MKIKILFLVTIMATVIGISNCVVQTAGPSCTRAVSTHTSCTDYSSAGYDSATTGSKELACGQPDGAWPAGTWNALSACDVATYAHSCSVSVSGGLLGAAVKTYYNDPGALSAASYVGDQAACGVSLGSWK